MSQKRTVAIIGGGVAGSFAGTLLSRAGWGVTMVESRHVIAPWGPLTVIFPDAMNLLDIVIPRNAIVEDLGMTIKRLVMKAGRSTFRGLVSSCGGYDNGLGFCRNSLESSLHSDFAQRGRLLLGSKFVDAVRLEDSKSAWDVVVSNHQEVSETISADVLIMAVGSRPKVVQSLFAERTRHRCGTRIAYRYLRVDPGNQTDQFLSTEVGDDSGRVNLFRFPVAEGADGLGAEWCAESSNAGDEARRYLGVGEKRSLKWLTEAREASLPDMVLRRPYSDRVLAVGDVGMTIDPLTGQGVSNALFSAAMAVESLLRWEGGEKWSKSASAYERTRDDLWAPDFERAANLAAGLAGSQPDDSSHLVGKNPYTWVDLVSNKVYADGRTRCYRQELPVLVARLVEGVKRKK